MFSLGATLFECATGHKLPRSEGWGEGDADRLEVPGRPAAFVALLRAMLQPNPALRPTAQQVVDVVAQEQPAIAAAAAETVAVTATAHAVAAATAAAANAPLQQTVPAGSPLALSPFAQPADGVPVSASAAAAAAPAAAAAVDRQFSFDVPAQPVVQSTGRFAFTPMQPLRPSNHNRRSSSSGSGPAAPPGSAVKGTPAARPGGPARWAPALSPLISEGALTPGAIAALAGLTPTGHSGSDGAPTPVFGGSAGSGSSGRAHALRQSAGTPLDARRPSPLQLPQIAALAVPSAPTGGHSRGSQDSKDGWRLSRRDIVSPDSDLINGAGWWRGTASVWLAPRLCAMPGTATCCPPTSCSVPPRSPAPAAAASHSESGYSFSCGTGRTLSDMDFADALSPMSQGAPHRMGW